MRNSILLPFDTFEALEEGEVVSLRSATLAPPSTFQERLASILGERSQRLARLSSPLIQPKMEGVKVLSTYQEEPKKRSYQDFVAFFNSRYYALEKILRNRQELSGVISIGRVAGKKDRENVAIIGIISSKSTTKNGNIILKLEDPTGEINVLFSLKRVDMFALAKDLVLDEVIGITGQFSESPESKGKWVMANNVLFPDIPLTKELKKSPEEGYAIFLSDLHIGSKEFLEENFIKMIKWIAGELGSESQKDIAKRIKYVFIAGDLVEGIGIYQGQENSLAIRDIFKQYDRCAELLSNIPDHIPLVICPGNHDALRITEPQPALYKDFSKAMWDLKNVYLLSNPCMVNIDSSDVFPGFDVLMYHGYSFDYYAANVDSIRQNGGYDRADLIMKFLLQRRHLAPTHTSTQYLPDTRRDPLVIDKVPDFFLTGHVHRASAAVYRNITMVSGSCWQDMTPFQEKVGHNPEPCRVFALDLQSRVVKILRF